MHFFRLLGGPVLPGGLKPNHPFWAILVFIGSQFAFYRNVPKPVLEILSGLSSKLKKTYSGEPEFSKSSLLGSELMHLKPLKHSFPAGSGRTLSLGILHLTPK